MQVDDDISVFWLVQQRQHLVRFDLQTLVRKLRQIGRRREDHRLALTLALKEFVRRLHVLRPLAERHPFQNSLSEIGRQCETELENLSPLHESGYVC